MERQRTDRAPGPGFADRATFVRPRFLQDVELVAVSYRRREFPTHTHDGYVVGTVLAGAEALSVGGRTYHVGTGDVLHLHPDEPHANRSLGTDPLRYRVFYIPSARLMSAAGDGRAAPLSFSTPVRHDPSLARTLADLHLRLSQGPVERLAQESAFAALVAALQASSSQPRAAPRREPQVVRALRSWIDIHFAENFGLTDLAALAGVSVFHVAHLFKAGAGISPLAYRNQRRLREAQRLLLKGEPIADVALQVGFVDQSHLTRHFQRVVGVSPSRYRQQ